MFVPPEQRRSWVPPPPEGRISKRAEGVLLWLIGFFLLAMLLAPIGGGTLIQAVRAVLVRMHG